MAAVTGDIHNLVPWCGFFEAIHVVDQYAGIDAVPDMAEQKSAERMTGLE